MQINYMENPSGIVKRFTIQYGKSGNGRPLYLEGRIIGHMEEDDDKINWFSGKIVYAKNGCEVGGQQQNEDYDALKKSVPTIEEVTEKMITWCNSFPRMDFVSESVNVKGLRNLLPGELEHLSLPLVC